MSSFSKYVVGAIAVGLSLAVLISSPALVSQESAKSGQRAYIRVAVPKTAQVEIDGNRTTQTGSNRRYVSPPLALGKKYFYTIKASWKGGGGQQIVSEKVVQVRPGGEVSVDLRSGALASPVVAKPVAAKGDANADLVQRLFPPSGPAIPKGLVPVIWPLDNQYSPEKAELGWLLYFDKRLSADGTVSCASCHDPKFGFTDGQAVSTGIKGQKGNRSAPTVINRAYSVEQFWDGRAPTLEEQAKGPIANPIEMGNTHDNVVATLRDIPGYRRRFKKVFGKDDFDIDDVAKAIATFERTVLSGNSPYDQFKAGKKDALTESQQRGMKLFFSTKLKCDSCHEGINLTAGKFTNLGIGMDKPKPDLGRYNYTKKEEEKGAFKTPTVREIAHTAPYMHDGRFKTLEEVVEHYNKGGVKNNWLHQDIKPLKLKDGEKKDLVNFLKALSGEGWQHIKPPVALPQ